MEDFRSGVGERRSSEVIGSPGVLGLVEEEGEGDSSGGWCGVFRGKW